MKPVLHAIALAFVLSFVHGSALAYSGSECEVNDCSNSAPGKGATKAAKPQPKTKAELKEAAKEEAKNQGKAKLMDSAPSPVKDAAGFFK